MGPRKPKKPEQTTVVLSGLPKTLNADVLLGLLDEHFACTYDYFYLPMDMERFESWGLAYINFRSHERLWSASATSRGWTDGRADIIASERAGPSGPPSRAMIRISRSNSRRIG